MGIASANDADRTHRSVDGTYGVADLIRATAVALITTVDDTGVVRTRQVPNTNAGVDDDLWFLASSESPLWTDLRQHADVLVTFADRGTGRFIIVNGTARLRSDRERVRQLWHPVLASWLPDGPDDPALGLIQVQAQGVDLWDSPPGRPKGPAAARE